MVTKLLHIFCQQIMLLEWPSRISRVFDLTILIFNLLPFRIKKLEKACVDLAALRTSVRTLEVDTHKTH